MVLYEIPLAAGRESNGGDGIIMVHELKILPEHFADIRDGYKEFEIRHICKNI